MAQSIAADADSGAGFGVVSRPDLNDMVARGARVTVVAAPAGSGKTVLLRSWIGETDRAKRIAYASVQREQRDAQRFWTSVVEALRATDPGSALVRPLSATPAFDGWTVVERLLEDLAALEERLWLVLDDLHELTSDDALRQLELLLLRAPDTVRFVLSTRHDLRLGTHRLRVSGELTEIRGDDLRLTLDEARLLMEQAGVQLSDGALTLLVERTEGWAAGLRLAALSLARHPDPERFAEEFSGSERTVAEYLLSEVLERQPAAVRKLLLRTSILDTVNGPLADLLTGDSGGERILQELEAANALVVSVDSRRSWFRYHHLLADMLRLELRRSEPAGQVNLHAAAADWYAAHGYPVEALRHTLAAGSWPLAARRLFDYWVELNLDGRASTAHALLAAFPADVAAADAELTTLMAADELNRGSLDKAGRYLELAKTRSVSVAPERRERFEVMHALQRLYLARQRTDVAGVIQAAERLVSSADRVHSTQLELGDDLRALALLSLGIAEVMAARLDEADQHLEQGVTLAHRTGRAYLEVYGLAQWASVGSFKSFDVAIERGLQAIELARQHGWSDEPILVNAYASVALCTLWRGELEGAEQWLRNAERVVRPDVDPAMGLVVLVGRAELEVARGRYQEALAALRAGEQLPGLLVAPRPIALHTRSFLLQTLVKSGETQAAEAALNQLSDQERDCGEMRVARAVLQLAQGNPTEASATLAPVVDGSEPVFHRNWMHVALVLDAIARGALGDAERAGRALERALDLAEPDGMRLAFLFHPASELLERHRRTRTAHGAFIAQILDGLAGQRLQSSSGASAGLLERLSVGETRVLRYLPTNLSLTEIARELHVSTNTVKTHVRHVYAKLAAHSRSEAVRQARRLRLLAPESRRG